MSEPIIKCENLRRRYRRHALTLRTKPVLEGVDLEVLEGECYTLMGSNGAGKSTLIKLLMNLIKPGSGYAAIDGTPCSKLSRLDLQKIGFVSESQEIPEAVTIRYWLDYLAPFYPTWDRDFEKQLLKDLDLDPRQRVRSLSRGMRMKLALIAAIAYRPRLLILDEPFSGLDALVRDEFISGLLEVTNAEGWTMFMASHDFDEVERLTDRLGMLHEGRMILNESVDDLRSRYTRVHVSLPESFCLDRDKLPSHWGDLQSEGSELYFVDSAFENREKTEADINRVFESCKRLDLMPISLRDTFVSIAREMKTAKTQTGIMS